MRLLIIFEVVNVSAPERTYAASLCSEMTKDKRNWRKPENKTSTTPGALWEISDYHRSGNKPKTAGSASDYCCFFFPSYPPKTKQAPT